MKKRIIISLLLVILLLTGWKVIGVLISAGSFKTIEPHFQGKLERIDVPVAGPEDIEVDDSTGLVFISACDRRTSARGAILVWNPDDSLQVFRDVTPANLTDFRPHGISLHRSASGALLLFVINHRHQQHGDVVERLQWKDGSFRHLETIADAQLMTAPNDLVAVGERAFYITNDHYYPTPGLSRTLEEYLQREISFVNYYDGQAFRTVADGFAYANGIGISPDQKVIYVASCTGGKVSAFDRATDGSLSLRWEHPVKTGVDNIDVDAAGDLWIGCHPQLLKFAAHSRDSSAKSPSQVIRLIPGDQPAVEEVLLTDGRLYSGSSVAVRRKNQLLVGSVFEPTLLVGRLE